MNSIMYFLITVTIASLIMLIATLVLKSLD